MSSLTLNMVGGGGGLAATDALLRVQAPANSTVTITKGTTTKTDFGHENADDHTKYDYYFIIHQSQFDSVNAWNVTATLGARTAVATIIIDLADEYDLALTPLVPIEYQAVEYLLATGTQYINTGVAPQYATFKTKVMFTEMPTTSTGYYRYIYCAQNASSPTNGQYLRLAHDNRMMTDYYDYFFQNSMSTNTEYTFEAVDTSSTTSLTRNGVTQTNGTTRSAFTSYPLFLFANDNGGTPYTQQNMKGRIYYWQVVNESNELVADFIPCYRKSDSVAGMWDSVTNTFFTNSGSGTFTVGGDI